MQRITLFVLVVNLILTTTCTCLLIDQRNATKEVHAETTSVKSEEPETELVMAEEIVEEPDTSVFLEKSDIDLLALVTMAEAEGESEYGKRLVIDTILNRVDSPKFPDSVYDVVYQPNQFTSMWNGRVDRCYVREDIRQLVIEEAKARTNSEVVFFRTNHYSNYGTPVFQEGNHYFSKY